MSAEHALARLAVAVAEERETRRRRVEAVDAALAAGASYWEIAEVSGQASRQAARQWHERNSKKPVDNGSLSS